MRYALKTKISNSWSAHVGLVKFFHLLRNRFCSLFYNYKNLKNLQALLIISSKETIPLRCGHRFNYLKTESRCSCQGCFSNIIERLETSWYWHMPSLVRWMLPKLPLIWNNLPNKVVEKSILYKKVSGGMWVSPPSSGTKGLITIPVHYNISNMAIFRSPPMAPLLGEIDICARRLFCRKFNAEQLLLEAFFHIIRIFVSVQP